MVGVYALLADSKWVASNRVDDELIFMVRLIGATRYKRLKCPEGRVSRLHSLMIDLMIHQPMFSRLLL